MDLNTAGPLASSHLKEMHIIKQHNLNNLFPFRVKTKTSAKYGLEAQPRLVDIIAAVPPQYRRALVPKLKAKPIRTASGVCTPQSIVHHAV